MVILCQPGTTEDHCDLRKFLRLSNVRLTTHQTSHVVFVAASVLCTLSIDLNHWHVYTNTHTHTRIKPWVSSAGYREFSHISFLFQFHTYAHTHTPTCCYGAKFALRGNRLFCALSFSFHHYRIFILYATLSLSPVSVCLNFCSFLCLFRFQLNEVRINISSTQHTPSGDNGTSGNQLFMRAQYARTYW